MIAAAPFAATPRLGTAPDQPPTVLRCVGLVKRFGGITATQNVSLDLRQGARHALIGPNGAGKTTLINLLTGVLEPTEGTIELLGADVTRLAPHLRVSTWHGANLPDQPAVRVHVASGDAGHGRVAAARPGRRLVAATGALLGCLVCKKKC